MQPEASSCRRSATKAFSHTYCLRRSRRRSQARNVRSNRCPRIGNALNSASSRSNLYRSLRFVNRWALQYTGVRLTAVYSIGHIDRYSARSEHAKNLIPRLGPEKSSGCLFSPCEDAINNGLPEVISGEISRWTASLDTRIAGRVDKSPCDRESSAQVSLVDVQNLGCSAD